MESTQRVKKPSSRVNQATGLQSLRHSEVRYRRLFEAAQDGISIVTAKTGVIKDVNPYLINFIGNSQDEFLEKRLWEVGAFKDVEAGKEPFLALQKEKFLSALAGKHFDPQVVGVCLKSVIPAD